MMKVQISSHFFAFALVLEGVTSIGNTEPDGTPAPQIPDGVLTPDGEITDSTIPNPAPEFPAPVDGTPNITCRPFYTETPFATSYVAKTAVRCTTVVAEFIHSSGTVCGR